MLDEAVDSLEDPSASGNATWSLSSSPPTEPSDPRALSRLLILLVSIIDFDRTVARMLSVVVPTIDLDALFNDRNGAGDSAKALAVAKGMHSSATIPDVSVSGLCTPLSSSSPSLMPVANSEQGLSNAFSMLFESGKLPSRSLSPRSVIDDKVGAHGSLFDSTSPAMLTAGGSGRR